VEPVQFLSGKIGEEMGTPIQQIVIGPLFTWVINLASGEEKNEQDSDPTFFPTTHYPIGSDFHVFLQFTYRHT
jgi:hypothetical protein